MFSCLGFVKVVHGPPSMKAYVFVVDNITHTTLTYGHNPHIDAQANDSPLISSQPMSGRDKRVVFILVDVLIASNWPRFAHVISGVRFISKEVST